MGPLGDLLKEEFGFTDPLGGPEWKVLPSWKRAISDRLLEKAMSYRSAKEHFANACKSSKNYIFYAKQVVNREWYSTPLGASMGRVETHFLNVITLRTEIESLIKIYNSAE